MMESVHADDPVKALIGKRQAGAFPHHEPGAVGIAPEVQRETFPP
jgi:hypothetical protein